MAQLGKKRSRSVEWQLANDIRGASGELYHAVGTVGADRAVGAAVGIVGLVYVGMTSISLCKQAQQYNRHLLLSNKYPRTSVHNVASL